MSESLRVCVLIPAYNEAERIGLTVAALKARPEIGEIVVMDDGSSDGTGDAARSAGRGSSGAPGRCSGSRCRASVPFGNRC